MTIDWSIRAASLADVDNLALVGSATFLETFAGVLDGPAIISHCLREHSSYAYQNYLESARAWLVESAIGGAPIGFSLVGEPSLPGSSSDGRDV
jgi:hypothetical protein